MKTICALMFAFMISTVTQAQSQAPGAIEGSWQAQRTVNGILLDMTFAVNTKSVTLTNVCSANGISTQAQITVASAYTDSTLEFLEEGHDQESNSGLNCNVSVQPKTLDYQLNVNNELILIQQDSHQSFTFIRKIN